MAQEANINVSRSVGAGGASPSAFERAERLSTRPVLTPAADIYETREGLVLVAELPGIPPEGIDITLERRVLTIRGRGNAAPPSGYRQIYREYVDGDFERQFTLPEDIDRDRIEARHKDGVLHLVLPKAQTAKARKIELKTG